MTPSGFQCTHLCRESRMREIGMGSNGSFGGQYVYRHHFKDEKLGSYSRMRSLFSPLKDEFNRVDDLTDGFQVL